MSVEKVREYLAGFGLADRILEFGESSATVELAAHAVGVEPARIAKSMAFRLPDRAVIVVTAGDARVKSGLFKAEFHGKAKMVAADELPELVGHPMGGVCPFALRAGAETYLDVSLRRFDTVYPAAGSPSSAVRLTLDELERASCARGWVDVCDGWRTDEG